MSQVFEAYERQYCELSTNLSRKCTGVASLPHDSDQKTDKVSEINSGLDDADVLIRKMDLEARSLQPSVKAALLAKLREYKADLNRLKKEFKRLSSPDANQASRDHLLPSGIADSQNVAADQRERLTMSVERLDQSSDRIKESRRTLFETEEIGISILEDLHQQHQTLLHSHSKSDVGIEFQSFMQVKENRYWKPEYFDVLRIIDHQFMGEFEEGDRLDLVDETELTRKELEFLKGHNLHGVNDAVDKSKKVLTAMSRRITRNKWIVGSVIAALVVAIIFILIFKLSH
ncbi:hypothetical protein ACFE04_024449 [Oxalis oulophora]